MKIDRIKIKLAIAQKEMNQTEFAEKCGISRQSICAILGRGTCSIANVGKIAKALGIEPQEIIKEE